MDVHQGGTRLVGLARRFDLLGDRHRKGWIVGLARDGTGDGDGDDDRFHDPARMSDEEGTGNTAFRSVSEVLGSRAKQPSAQPWNSSVALVPGPLSR